MQIKYYVIKHLILQKIQNIIEYQHRFASTPYRCFDEKKSIRKKEQELILT